MGGGDVFGPRTIQIYNSSGVAAMPVGAHSATIYSHSFDLTRSTFFGVMMTAAGTTVKMVVELEVSDVRPTTEGAADTVNYAVPDNMPEVNDDLADTNLFITSMSPPAFQYGRFKIKTGAGNTADTTINIKLSTLEG